MTKVYKKITLWTPEKENEEREGNFLDVSEEHSEEYGDSKLYVIETDSEVVSLYGSTALDKAMRVIKVDERVRIVFKGRKQGEAKSKQPYKIFEVSKVVVS